MDRFVRNQNIARFRKQLEETPDDAQRETLRKLLADEEAKDYSPPPREK